MATYRVMSTIKTDKTTYEPKEYGTFKEALKALKDIIVELDRIGGFINIPISDVCYEVHARYGGYSKRMGSLYVKKFV